MAQDCPTEGQYLELSDTLIGVEIGATKLQVVVGDQEAVILERRRLTADREGGAVAIRAQLEDVLGTLLEEFQPRAVGVGFGGPVDIEAGRIAISHQVEGWADFPLRDWLRELTGLPVIVENDTNAAALAEALRGAGRDRRLVFYTNFGSGMGGGMVIDGELYHGAAPGESELGLTLLNRSGITFESRCCGWAVDQKVRAHIEDHPDGLLAELAGGSREGAARFLRPALQRGDAPAQAILNETAEDIAFAVSHVAHLFHPEVVILGGGLSLIGEPLREAVARFVPGFVTQSFRPGPGIRLSALGEDVVCVGALLLAMQTLADEGIRHEARPASAPRSSSTRRSSPR
jgi:glucokinase